MVARSAIGIAARNMTSGPYFETNATNELIIPSNKKVIIFFSTKSRSVRTLQIGNYCHAFSFPFGHRYAFSCYKTICDWRLQDHTFVTGTIIDSGEHAIGLGEATININWLGFHYQ